MQRLVVEGGEWIDGLPLAWHEVWLQSPWCAAFSLATLQRMIDWLQNERMSAVISCNISWIELTAMLEGTNFTHPFLVPNGSLNIWSDPSLVSVHLHRPLTVAARIRFLRDFFRCLDSCFDLGIPFVRGLNLASFQIHPPQSGITMHISAQTLRQGELLLRGFTSTRPVRTVNDLARPL